MELILQVFYSVFSGALLAVAIPNELYLFGCPIYVLLAFIPYYLVFNRIKNYKQAFLCGFCQAATTHLASSYWLANFKDFAALTLGASAFGTGCIGAFFGLFLYLPYSASRNHNKLNESCLHQKFYNTVSFRILYFASVYTIYEWVKSCGFLGYPWGTVSSAVYKWNILRQLASITGTYGITFILVFFNGLAAESFIHINLKNSGRSDSNRQYYLCLSAVLFAALFIPVMIYGLFQYNCTRKPIKTVSTILVQQNSDPWKEKTDTESILTSQELTSRIAEEMKSKGEYPELVVWSEGCLKKAYPNSRSYYRNYPTTYPLTLFISDIHAPFILGGSYVKDAKLKKFNNAALLFDKDGVFRGYYAKNHLVPFAEALPFIEYPKIKEIMQKIVGISAGWTPGDQYVFFEIPCHSTEDYRLPAVKNIDVTKDYTQQLEEEETPVTVKISSPICFDDSFTDIMRPMFLNGAELFVNITDDSWSLTKSSELQHFVIASYRAIEYRTTLVRSTNAGYSVVVDPSGKIIADLPLFQQEAMNYNVPVYKHKMTTYARFGNWLPYTLVVLFFAYTIFSFITFQKTDFIPSERKIKKSKKHKKNSKKISKNKK